MLIIECSNAVVLFVRTIADPLSRTITCVNDKSVLTYSNVDPPSLIAAVTAMRAKAVSIGGAVQRVYDITAFFTS